MNNISILNKKNCTGCRMCEQICPVNAIKMIENEEGFIEPTVDEKKCINCGICSKKCPQLNDIEYKRLENLEVYAAKNRNIDEQKKSSSGGVFSAIANYVLENEGIVYGCAFNKEFVAEHIGIQKKNELYKLKGSKYVQSNTMDTFNNVKEYLNKNKIVAYSGTPCQIAGLKNFLGKEYENLITIDLLCHGVPSPKTFKEYIKYLENKSGKKIQNYEFRNKEKQYWNLGYKIKITFEENEAKFINGDEDIYTNAFSKGIMLREVCYNCKYTNNKRMGDITLGDFWGVDKTYPKLYDKNGVSVILVNTLKGKEILDKIKKEIIIDEVEYEEVENYADTLKQSCERNDERNKIFEKIEKEGIYNILKKKISIKSKIKKYIPSMLRLKLKEIKK